MAMYALGTKNLISELKSENEPSIVNDTRKQVWYADDSYAIGMLRAIKEWWDKLNERGPKYGYFTNASKTTLVVKTQELYEIAQEMFLGTGIKINIEGKRVLGAAVGTAEYERSYVKDKVDAWVKDVKELAVIANDEPQLALSAFTKGLSHRWSFIQRTISNISDLFEPLEEAIRDDFIPSITGREVTELERVILRLPVRLGGLGIANPIATCQSQYDASKRITENLTALILNQDDNLNNLDK